MKTEDTEETTITEQQQTELGRLVFEYGQARFKLQRFLGEHPQLSKALSKFDPHDPRSAF